MEDPENFWVILWILKVTRSPCSENLCWNKHNFFVNESTGAPVVDWLVVWNINFIFPYIGNNHPNWLIFFSGVQTTNQFWTSLKVWVFLRSYPRSLTQKPTQIVDERVMTSVFSREAWWYLDPHDMFFLCWWSFPSQLLVLYRTGNQLIFCHGKANDITIGQVGTENINSGAPHEKSIIRITYSIWCILYACIRAWFLCPIFFQTSPNYWKNSKKINNRYTYIYIYLWIGDVTPIPKSWDMIIPTPVFQIFSMFHEIHLFPRGNLPVRHATVVVAAGMLNCLQAALQFGGPGSKICNQSFHANNKNVCKTMP